MLREISPITCRQFVTQQSPAIVITIVQLCFTPPFMYIVIKHNKDSILYISTPYSKEQIESIYKINLSSNDGEAIQELAKVV